MCRIFVENNEETIRLTLRSVVSVALAKVTKLARVPMSSGEIYLSLRGIENKDPDVYDSVMSRAEVREHLEVNGQAHQTDAESGWVFADEGVLKTLHRRIAEEILFPRVVALIEKAGHGSMGIDEHGEIRMLPGPKTVEMLRDRGEMRIEDFARLYQDCCIRSAIGKLEG